MPGGWEEEGIWSEEGSINYTMEKSRFFRIYLCSGQRCSNQLSGGGTAVVDGGKFADLAVSSWLHGRGIGKRGEERVRIQLHCEKWQNPDRNKYSPQKGDRMRRQKSLAAMALCAMVITMVSCGSLKSAGVSGGDV